MTCMAANMTSIPVMIEEKGEVVNKLSMDGNYLTKLLDYEFYIAGFKNVEILSLKNSNVKKMEEKLFYKLPNLQRLDLSNNLISNLHPRQFYYLPKLRSLDLSHNTLSYLHGSTITSLATSLSHLHLAGNILTSLPSSTFSILSRLSTLDLSSNPWTCNCMLAELHFKLRLANSIPADTMCSAPLALLEKTWDELDTSAFLCKPDMSVQDLVTSEVGFTVTMSCNVTSSPDTEVMWVDGDYGQVIHHLGHPVQERDSHLYQMYNVSTTTDHTSGKYSTTTLSQLNINNVSKTSAGLYTCLAWNKVGMEQKNIVLKVEKRNIKSEKQNLMSLMVVVPAGISALALVLILCLCVWRSGFRVYVVKDEKTIQIKAGSRKNNTNDSEVKAQMGEKVKGDDNVTLSRHSTEITVVKSEDSFNQRSDDHIVSKLCGDVNVMHIPPSHQEKKTIPQDESQPMYGQNGHGHYNNQGSLYNYFSHLLLSSPYYGASASLSHGPYHRTCNHCPYNHHTLATYDTRTREGIDQVPSEQEQYLSSTAKHIILED